MIIEEVKITDIKPYERNQKKHPESQVKNIAKSIEKYGFVQPIVIDKNNEIIIGHGRYTAGGDILGMDTVPCVRAENLTDKQIRELRILDNKLNESDWDIDNLKLDLDDLDFSDFEDLNFNLDFDLSEENHNVIEDEAPEINENADPVAKHGQIYKLGNHRLMCGDSTNADDVNRLMNGNKADAMFTDPPYGYNYQSNRRPETEKFDVLENDDKILDFFPLTKEICDGFIFVCTTWKVLDKWISLFKKCYELSNMIIWNKGGGGIGDLKHTFFTDYEVILCSNNSREITGKRIGSVWSIGKDDVNAYVHPTQKPVAVSATAIENTTNKGDAVLDLFGGSGSTLIACEQLERRCFMMELDPKYVDVIIQRWETFTGQKAELIN